MMVSMTHIITKLAKIKNFYNFIYSETYRSCFHQLAPLLRGRLHVDIGRCRNGCFSLHWRISGMSNLLENFTKFKTIHLDFFYFSCSRTKLPIAGLGSLTESLFSFARQHCWLTLCSGIWIRFPYWLVGHPSSSTVTPCSLSEFWRRNWKQKRNWWTELDLCSKLISWMLLEMWMEFVQIAHKLSIVPWNMKRFKAVTWGTFCVYVTFNMSNIFCKFRIVTV